MNATIFKEKRILLGITGSIACYKAVDMASRLTKSGAFVDVIMTESASRFVSALSFRSVTGREVYTDIWSLDGHIQHVDLGEAADLFVIAPATAHTMAKIAHGLADNLLTVTALATRCQMIVAPAMDAGMYTNPATQANVVTLKERGFLFAGPVEGRMASGLTGLGRMMEPADLIGHIRLALSGDGPLSGRKIVVTAGPTREALDPVRFLSNRSSGRQGYALAQAAVDAGADVTLISGPVQRNSPVGVKMISVNSALEMSDAVLREVEGADALLMAAAVSDFRPAKLVKQKIKKVQAFSDGLGLPLVSNPDILEQVMIQKVKSGYPTLTLGFAAETENLLDQGREKLIRKGLDFIAINDVGAKDSGFGVDTNRIILLGSDGSMTNMPVQSKSAVSEEIIKVIVGALDSEEG